MKTIGWIHTPKGDHTGKLGTAGTWTAERLEKKIQENFRDGFRDVIIINLVSIFNQIKKKLEKGEFQFGAKRVFEITGVKLNRLQPWMERRFILPSIHVASGHGTRNIFSQDDLCEISLFKDMVERGLKREVANEIMGTFSLKGLHEYHQTTESDLWVVVMRAK